MSVFVATLTAALLTTVWSAYFGYAGPFALFLTSINVVAAGVLVSVIGIRHGIVELSP